MLYALRYPLSFVVLVVAFLLGVCARGLAHQWVSRQRRPAWARQHQSRIEWIKPFVDPYGCVAAALGGVGWGAAIDITETRGRGIGRRTVQLLAGPVVMGGLGIAALAGFRASSRLHGIEGDPLLGVVRGSAFVVPGSHVHYALPFGQVALFLAGVLLLAMGILALIPLPPLDGGKLLFASAPPTPGWKRMSYRLDDEHWGVLVLLILSLPLLSRTILLVALLGDLVNPVVRLVA